MNQARKCLVETTGADERKRKMPKVKVCDSRGLELVSQDVVGFTLDQLVAHLNEHDWQQVHCDAESLEFVFTDEIVQVLTLRVFRKEQDVEDAI